jgi:hypothetical protein
MTISAVLLRVLLVLALVLNGIGSAVAGVHAHAGHADAVPAQALASDADAPCHEPAPVPAPEPVAAGDAADCCEGARCDCACTAAGATVAAFELPTLATPPVALATHRLDAGHRAPALAHLIRPPIG